MSKKKSAEMHKLQGTFQPCRHEKGQEPEIQAIPADSKPPSWLNLPAKRLYRKMAKNGIITDKNSDLLAIYCDLCLKITVSFQNGDPVTPSLLAQLRGLARDLEITGNPAKPEGKPKEEKLPYGWHRAHQKMYLNGVDPHCSCTEGLPFGIGKLQ